MLHPPKRHVILKFFPENKLLYFSKRPLCAGTARKKWLKEILSVMHLQSTNIVVVVDAVSTLLSAVLKAVQL